ncbi:dehydrogenase [Candidatus Saccharibacteria bacterium]|nr:MAG: dehydrogenase [Candidatus Saccharibacteria bacterium]
MKNVAILGLGVMGHGIADNFLKAGYSVAVWNRSPEKADDLVARGAQRAESVAQAVEGADLVFEVTANDESARKVWLGKDGIVARATPDQALITCATLSVECVDELARVCREKSLVFFDMPMTGSRAGAENGTLVLMAGGDRAKLQELAPDLQAISSRVKHFGPAGHGMRFKLVLNALQAIHMTGFGEAMRLAKAMGLDEKLTGNALAERPGGTTSLLTWQGYQHQPEEANFSVEWIAKDNQYALKGVAPELLPVFRSALAYYEKAIAEGHAHDDWTYVAR